jgi:cell wall-associated NlpC family hydrolase
MVIIGAGKPGDRNYLPLATRRGRSIENTLRMERAPEALGASVKIWNRQRPAAQLRSITAVYDCMGLVFACRRTWVELGELHKILQDDEYQRLSGPEEVEIGDIVIYYDGGRATHVGVVVDVGRHLTTTRSITVMSKWGADGEYIHPVNHVPEAYGQHVEYWTERKIKT